MDMWETEYANLRTELLDEAELDYELLIRGIEGLSSRAEKRKALKAVIRRGSDPEQSVIVLELSPSVAAKEVTTCRDILSRALAIEPATLPSRQALLAHLVARLRRNQLKSSDPVLFQEMLAHVESMGAKNMPESQGAGVVPDNEFDCQYERTLKASGIEPLDEFVFSEVTPTSSAPPTIPTSTTSQATSSYTITARSSATGALPKLPVITTNWSDNLHSTPLNPRLSTSMSTMGPFNSLGPYGSGLLGESPSSDWINHRTAPGCFPPVSLPLVSLPVTSPPVQPRFPQVDERPRVVSRIEQSPPRAQPAPVRALSPVFVPTHRPFDMSVRGLPVSKWNIPKFGGNEEELGRFMALVENFARAENASEDDLYRGRVHLVTGRVLDWALSETSRNWTEWQNGLTDFVLGARSDYDRIRQIEETRQGSESCAEFIDKTLLKFRNLRSQLPEIDKVELILRVLRPTIGLALASNPNVTSIRELREAATRLERIAGRHLTVNAVTSSSVPANSNATAIPTASVSSTNEVNAVSMPPRTSNRTDTGSATRSNRPIPPPRCFLCGRTGHRYIQCRQPTRCFGCRADGHTIEHCPLRNQTEN